MKYIDILTEHEALSSKQTGSQFRISVLSNITTNQIKEILELSLFQEGINAAVQFGQFDNLVQDSAHQSEYDAVLVFWEVCETRDWLSTKIDLLSDLELEALYVHLVNSIDLMLKNLCNTRAVVFNRFSGRLFSDNALNKTRLEMLADRLNVYLEKIKPSNVTLVDLDRVYSIIGIRKCTNWRDYYNTKALYSVDFFQSYVTHILPIFKSITGNIKKALILDCDNTLWSGVLGEDGLGGIDMSSSTQAGKLFSEVQRIICSLRKQGVIIGLCSKNNEHEVNEVFASHPDMQLKSFDITIKKINWKDKVDNLEAIADELNIGLDSLVFIDDSEFELESVKSRLPAVAAYKVPVRLDSYPALLREISSSCFSMSGTIEDARRTDMYREQIARNNAKAEFKNIDDYISSLCLEVHVARNSCEVISRVTQMSQRTNQFNLTTIRYTDREISDRVKSQEFDIFTLSAADKFGDYGVTGLCILENLGRDQTVNIDSFLMSCRIIGRGIEYVFFDNIVEWIEQQNVESITARYTSSGRNGQVKNFYDELGFDCTSCQGKSKDYQVSVRDYRSRNIGYIGVTCDY